MLAALEHLLLQRQSDLHCADCVQTTASSIGINSIQSAYGPIKVPRAHIMLATYGVTSPTEAGHMTHAHTFTDQ